MSFLAPLFLVGLAGLAIPVLIHLTRHERGRPVRFPSLMFLDRIPFQETSRRRIRNWVLLLVRLAALALLVAAFARPFVRGGVLASVGGPGPEEVVILLDRSYSMDLADHWEQAVSRAREVVGALEVPDRISLIAFSETPHLLQRSVADPRPVAAALDTLETSSLATRYAPAVKLAASIVETSTLSRRRVVMISDFQRSGWRPDRDAFLPDGVTVEPVVIGGTDTGTDGGMGPGDETSAAETPGGDNLALTGLVLRRESAGGRERVAVQVRLVNAGSGSTQADVALSVDETVVETSSVTAPPAGAAPVAFNPFTLTHPFTRGEVRVSDTGLQEDNTLNFVISPGGDIRVLIVDPLGIEESNLYLRGALGVAQGAGFTSRVIRGAPGSSQLESADLVILNGGPFPGGDAGDRLRAFVAGGGGLLVVLGERTRVPQVYADFLPVTVGTINDAAGERRRLGFVDYDHAIFEAFRGARSGDFSRVGFYRTRSVTVSGGQVLARFDDGSAALVEGRRGKGRILVWTTGLDRYWNDFPLQPVYLPFVHRVAEYLGGRGEVPLWHRAGSTINLADLAEAFGAFEIPEGAVAMDPGGGAVPLDPETYLLRLDTRGIWEIRPPGVRSDPPMALAVNVDLAESDLAKLDIEEFLGAIGGWEGGTGVEDASGEDALGTRPGVAGGEEAVRTAQQAKDFEERQSFWRFLLAAAFLAMVSETLLANRLSRHTIKGEGSGV